LGTSDSIANNKGLLNTKKGFEQRPSTRDWNLKDFYGSDSGQVLKKKNRFRYQFLKMNFLQTISIAY